MSTLWERVSKVLKAKSGSVLGIEVSSSSIKVVQVRKKGGQGVLETYGELAIGPYAGIDAGKATRLPPEKMAAALKDLMQEAKVTTKECGVAIPLSSSLVNVIQMPDLGEKRLKEMIPIEMRKYIPVSISEVVLDWRVIPKGAEVEAEEADRAAEPAAGKPLDKVDVLVVAIHKETVDRYQHIVEQAGLAPSFFEIEGFSTIRAVLDGQPASSMVIDFGSGATKMYIVERRVLRQSHSTNRGSQDMTIALSKSMGVSSEKAEELKRMYGVSRDAADQTVREVISLVLDNILTEARRVLLNYQKNSQQNVETVLLSGGGAGLKGLAEAALEVLQTEVAVADPFAKVVAPAFLKEVLADAGPEFAVAVGVALRKLDESSE